MKGILISLVIIGYVVLSLYRRFKRTLADGVQTNTTEEESYDSQEYEEPNYAYEESAEPSNPYFSYEYVTPDKKVPQAEKQKPIVEQKQQVDVVLQRNGFDLRQAVIYQTLLNNRYIDEINQ